MPWPFHWDDDAGKIDPPLFDGSLEMPRSVNVFRGEATR